MPNRIIREGILTSEGVNSLSWGGEVFYRRLMSKVDDFGRYDGRAAILRAELYGLVLSKVSESDVSSWIAECENAGLVRRYAVDSKPYLLLHKFSQQVRAKHSKWPDPPEDDSTCAQMRADAHLDVSVSEGADECAIEGAPRRGGDTHNGKITNSQAEAIYGLYPRKVGKQAAIKAIKSAHAKLAKAGHDDPVAFLTKQTAAYAASPSGSVPAGDDDYRPHPATWFNQGRYDDDPAEWQKPNGGGATQPAQDTDLGSRLGTRPATPAEARKIFEELGIGSGD